MRLAAVVAGPSLGFIFVVCACFGGLRLLMYICGLRLLTYDLVPEQRTGPYTVHLDHGTATTILHSSNLPSHISTYCTPRTTAMRCPAKTISTNDLPCFL